MRDRDVRTRGAMSDGGSVNQMARDGSSPGPGPVERGSTRWTVGIAMLALSVVLALTSFTEWAHMTYAGSSSSSGQVKVSAAMSGFGSVSVTVPGIQGAAQRHAAERGEAAALEAEGPNAPGIAVLTIGLLMAAAALAYLRTPRRAAAAGVVVGLSALGLMNGIWRIANPRQMFNDPAGWNSAHYSPGFGLVVATVVSLALIGLGVYALVLERRPTP